MTGTSAYERNIAEEPGALRSFANSALPPELSGLDLAGFDRIVLTGMGGSHFASHRTWHSLAARGLPAWWVSTAQLLDMCELVTPRSLLWVTSQSGESAEVTALIERLGPGQAPRTLLATTNDATSRLAAAAHIVVQLCAGEEAAVSTKTYANTLAAHQRALAALYGHDDAAVAGQVLAAADELERFTPSLGGVASRALDSPRPRFVLLANPADVPSALTGALLLKEAAKVPAEGFVRGEFRHGPIELAGPGLTVVLFGPGTHDRALSGLGDQLAGTGALVIHVDTAPRSPVPHLVTSQAASALGRAVCAAKLVQLLSVELARAQGIEPGSFRYGEKVTVSL